MFKEQLEQPKKKFKELALLYSNGKEKLSEIEKTEKSLKDLLLNKELVKAKILQALERLDKRDTSESRVINEIIDESIPLKLYIVLDSFSLYISLWTEGEDSSFTREEGWENAVDLQFHIYSEDEVNMSTRYTRPEYRGKGYATQLLNLTEPFLKKLGYNKISAETYQLDVMKWLEAQEYQPYKEKDLVNFNRVNNPTREMYLGDNFGVIDPIEGKDIGNRVDISFKKDI